jgi:hypothetical protein
MNARILTLENGKQDLQAFEDISIINTTQAFNSFTATMKSYYEDEFEMVTNQLGQLYDEQGNVRMRVYTCDPTHNGNDIMVIVMHDEEIEAEVEANKPLWHNLIIN